jgi:flagellar basal body-associated protein FliL
MADDSDSVAEEKRQLEAVKLKAEIEVLTAQAKALARQQTRPARLLEWLQASGAVTGLVAILGLVFTVWQSQTDLAETQKVKAQEQILLALDNLAADSVARRLSGLFRVRNALAEGDRKAQRLIVGGLVSALTLEKEPAVRDALVSTLQTLDRNSIGQGLADEALTNLVAASRTRVVMGDLLKSRAPDGRGPRERDSDEARADSIGKSIAGLLRLGAKEQDLSGIYCRRCDLSSLDLSRVNFANSILVGANFFEGEASWSKLRRS